MGVNRPGRRVSDGPRNGAEDRYDGCRDPSLEPGYEYDGKQIEKCDGNPVIAGSKVKTADSQYQEKSENREKWLREFTGKFQDRCNPHNVIVCPTPEDSLWRAPFVSVDSPYVHFAPSIADPAACVK